MAVRGMSVGRVYVVLLVDVKHGMDYVGVRRTPRAARTLAERHVREQYGAAEPCRWHDKQRALVGSDFSVLLKPEPIR